MVIHLQNTGKAPFSFDSYKERSTNNPSTVKADSLNLMQDPIITRKELAQKRAMKLVRDQFGRDQKLDQMVEESKQRVDTLLKEKQEYVKQTETFNGQQRELKDLYGVEDGSEEQNDLEILVKVQNNQVLTKEEGLRLNEMGPKTEYQTEALKLEESKQFWNKKAAGNLNQIAGENKMVAGMINERSKSHAMLTNQKMAEEIVNNASKDAALAMVNEAKDNIEEEFNEKLEEAKKIKEEKQKEEAKKAEGEEKTIEEKQAETSMDSYPLNDASQDKLQRELQKLVQMEKLLSEDLKGIEVDKSV